MLRPNEIDRVLSLARAQGKQRSVRHAEPPALTPRMVLPGRAHGTAAPGKAQTRAIQSVQASSGTGINRWWRYQEQNVPGGGHLMVNIGTGNLLFQDDDMNVPHKGLALAFRRTYNSQSLHTVAGGGAEDNGNGWAGPGMYGNGWTNTFDAHTVSLSPTQESVYDIDGARYDYTVPSDPAQWVPGMIATSTSPGNYTALIYDGACGWLWEKVSGTIYYFYTNNPSKACPGLTTLGAFSGRLRQIIGRNRYDTITFNYSWENGDASAATGKVHAIAAQTESGMTATLAFAPVAGHQLLQSITFPDNSTSVTYGYDSAGNLISVTHPANSAGQPVQTYGYQTVGSGSALYYIYSPRLNAPPFGSDGSFLAFLFTGTNPVTASLNLIAHWAFINPTIPDGSNSTALQPGYPTVGTYYQYEYYTTGVGMPTWRDTDGHATNWVVDSLARPTQTQECVAAVNQACTGTYLTTNESWDAQNNLVSEVDPRGGETDYAYDIDGNTVAVAAPAPAPGAFRPTSLYSYGAYDNVIAYCDPIATHAMQADWTSPPVVPLPGQGALCPAQSTAATRYQWAFPSYEPFGELASSTSPATLAAPNGYQRTYTYDAARQGGYDFGLPTSVTGATIPQNDPTTPLRQPQQSFWYDASGNLVCYGAGNGQWLLTYDALGRVTSVADPDDSASGAGTCGKSGAQASWNTTVKKGYFDDGSLKWAQTASQAANGISTTYTYDVDGNEKTETHHYSCVSALNCTAGVTQKFYDGDDRLVEVLQPSDGWDVQSYPWATRYIYDLSQGGTTTYRGIGLNGHGNLVSTQELLSGTVWQPNLGTTYGIGTGTWTDLRATAYDALDRPVASYEAAFGDQPKERRSYDGAGQLGLLTSVALATNELKRYTYDGIGREIAKSYSGGANITPGVQLTLDADGHVVASSTDVLGTETMQYDSLGNLLSTVEPASLGGGTVTYDYYPDGKRRDLQFAGGGVAYAPLLQYSYRNDGLRERLQLYNGTTFQWTFTAAGRELLQSDPLTGTSIQPDATYIANAKGKEVPYYPASVTYGPRTATYDNYGRLSHLGLPEAIGSSISYDYVASQYDLEDSVIGETRNRYAQGATGAPGATVSVQACLSTNIRNEQQSEQRPFIQSNGCGGVIPKHQDYNGTVLQASYGYSDASTVPAPWLLDARAGMQMNDEYVTPNGNTVGSGYVHDASGRLTQEFQGREPVCPAGSEWALGNQYARCYSNGSRQKTYDAENRLHSDVYSWASAGATVTTSYGASTIDGYFGNVQRTDAVDYNAASHPSRLTLSLPQYPGVTPVFETRAWLWDGNDRLLSCVLVNGQCTGTLFSLEGLGEYDPAAGLVWINDRNRAGQVVIGHNAKAFTGWSDSMSGPFISWQTSASGYGNGANDPCSSVDSNNCYLHDGKLTADGWTLGRDTWQGVRTYDGSVGQWNTPDAYAGDVHDPMSQKPFMWNRNNPYQYHDPTGYCVGVLTLPCAAGVAIETGITAAGAALGGVIVAGAGVLVVATAGPAGETPERLADLKKKEAEHTTNRSPSNLPKHEQGQARKGQDYGGEKGDDRRREPRKPDHDEHKGPYPPPPDTTCPICKARLREK